MKPRKILTSIRDWHLELGIFEVLKYTIKDNKLIFPFPYSTLSCVIMNCTSRSIVISKGTSTCHTSFKPQRELLER